MNWLDLGEKIAKNQIYTSWTNLDNKLNLTYVWSDKLFLSANFNFLGQTIHRRNYQINKICRLKVFSFTFNLFI